MAKHKISILVENQAGVLSKVSGLFSRRGFNIESLAVGETENPEFSRITIVVDSDLRTIDQVINQLRKLISVKIVKLLEPQDCVSRELALIKAKAVPARRSEIIQIVNIFRAKIIDVSTESLTIEITGNSNKVNALIDFLIEFGIMEISRTGLIALDRGSRTITDIK